MESDREIAMDVAGAPMDGVDAPPADLLSLTNWLLRQAIEAEDGRALLDRFGQALCCAGFPIVGLTVGLPVLDPTNQGVSLRWWRDRGTDFSARPHGVPGDEAFQRSLVSAILTTGQERASFRLERGEGCEAFPVLGEMRQAGATEYLVRMVRFASDIAIQGAALGFATDRPGGFSGPDLETIEALLPGFALTVYRICLSHTMRQVLGAYVGPMTAARVLNGSIRRGYGELLSAVILLVDLKRFTSLADREDPLKVVGWLDHHLAALGSGVGSNGGEILKFTGDGFIAVFPVSDREAVPCAICAQALQAVRTGLAANRSLERTRREAGEPYLEADLVLHFGDIVYGNIGTADRLDFTAIGRAVNEASRIEALCDETGCSVLLSDSFALRCAEPLAELGLFSLRGVDTPRRLWTIRQAPCLTASESDLAHLPAASGLP